MRTLNHLEQSPLDERVLLLRPDSVRTLDRAVPTADAILVVGPRIAAVGTVDECRHRAGELGRSRVEEVRLDGVLLPGFVDPHAHPLMFGQMLSWVDCGPEHAADIPGIVALLRRAANDVPAQQPIRGYGYEHRNLVEGRHPHRTELDAVATDREVYVMNASGHGGVVNTFTLERAGITRDAADPPGGHFFRDANGDLTGELSDAACDILTGVHGVKVGHHGPNFHLEDAAEEHVRQLGVAQDRFRAAGVTTIGDAQVSRREFDMYLRLAEEGRLRTRISMYLLSHLLDDAIDMGLHGAFGNAMLSFAGIKLYADGTLGGWTAYFPDGYVGDPCRTGQLYHEPEEYAALIARAHAVGLQTATHAQSPTAIGMVIDAIRAAQTSAPRPDARHRIEHCGLPTPDQIAAMARWGIRPVNQTQHYLNWGEGVTDAIGTPGERFNPLGEFVAAGVPVTLSSDAPVAEPNPLEAIQTAVTRRTRRGHRLGGDKLLIDAETALRAHTLGGAEVLGRETELGSIIAGKRADLVLLSSDPLSVAPEDISSIDVTATWLDGLPEHR
ncbi:amidohydrolase [Tsukamurella ocularis]|uniref:amidohydrolase n=1 Tax=Tsukamurella ocularis TaxID=1970234 RepID=UPI00216A44E8|nr:amidohydrolase [Tsukamurella ocularis]MCS3781276.1 putative amidohydrolase YtcJ [Tsukamurella ocularis]MCS3787647.1 putative amidohydrolase YtcJ [Tsukamurella ocularis]MCS3850942.1 putative amidohydrolase YtcJ [Tsukamurella ocularis]